MNTSTVEISIPAIEDVDVSGTSLTAKFSDGRVVSVPLAWFPRLLHANKKERGKWRLIGKGDGIHWDSVDEDISAENLLTGKPSGESLTSFKKWLLSRENGPGLRPKLRRKG